MAEPVISVPFEEMERSPTEDFAPEGFRAQRVLRCAWADRLKLADELQGSFLSGGSYIYDLPHLYPHRTGVRCVGVGGIVGHDEDRPMPNGGDTTVAIYQYALMTAQYANATPVGEGGGGSAELTTETIEPFSEFTTMPATGLMWGSTSGTPLDSQEVVGRLKRGFNWVFTRLNVATVPAEYASLIGSVNDAAITSAQLGFTFEAESLLYTPPILTRRVNADGVTSRWTITTRFTYSPPSWNLFYRPSVNNYVAIFNAAGQVKPYTPADLSPLIP
jgi:hypothetical protein